MTTPGNMVNPSLNNGKPSNSLLAGYGIILMLWGWASVLRTGLDYFEKYAYVSINLRQVVSVLGYIILLLWLVGTIYFLNKQRAEKLSHFGLNLRFVWISMILSLSLTSFIIANVLNESNFELQHPIFMVFIASATVISGGILRHKLLISGGIIFAICALISSYFELRDQILIETVGWIAAFIIPGHLMYRKRPK